MLPCTKCNTEKPDSEFYAHGPDRRRGRTHWCKECYAQNYANNRDRQRRSNRRAQIRRRYGLELDVYEALMRGGCTACGAQEGRIVMDHCHSTNKNRAPLCNGCNIALGAVEDDPQRLRDLADYLELHSQGVS